MRHKNFLKIHKIIGKKRFAKYLSADACFVKTIILLTVMKQPCSLFPDTRVFAQISLETLERIVYVEAWTL